LGHNTYSTNANQPAAGTTKASSNQHVDVSTEKQSEYTEPLDSSADGFMESPVIDEAN